MGPVVDHIRARIHHLSPDTGAHAQHPLACSGSSHPGHPARAQHFQQDTGISESMPKGEREVICSRWQFLFAVDGLLTQLSSPF